MATVDRNFGEIATALIDRFSPGLGQAVWFAVRRQLLPVEDFLAVDSTLVPSTTDGEYDKRQHLQDGSNHARRHLFGFRNASDVVNRLARNIGHLL